MFVGASGKDDLQPEDVFLFLHALRDHAGLAQAVLFLVVDGQALDLLLRDVAHAGLLGGDRDLRRDLLLDEAIAVIETYGISAINSLTASTAEEVVAAARRAGYPVAMKVVSEDISHKSDVGGVQLNLRNDEAVRAAFDDMYERIRAAYPDANLEGVLVQPMMTGGRELILGGRQDRQFGPVVLVGLGGIFVEIFEQASLRIAPVTRSEALEMIEQLAGSQILMGARGDRPYDIEAIVDAILRLSQLLVDFPEISELDTNPLRVRHEGQGCTALDARVILRR